MIDFKIVALSSSTVSPTEKINAIFRIQIPEQELPVNSGGVSLLIEPYFDFGAPENSVIANTEFVAASTEMHGDLPVIYPTSASSLPGTAREVAYGTDHTAIHYIDLITPTPILMKASITVPSTLGTAQFKAKAKWFSGAELIRTDIFSTNDEVRDHIKILEKPLTVNPPKFPSRPVVTDFQSEAFAGKLNVLRGANFGAEIADLYMDGVKVPDANVLLWNDNQISLLLPRAQSGNIIFKVRRKDIDLFSRDTILEVKPVPTPVILGTSWANDTATKGVKNQISIYGTNFQASIGIIEVSGQTSSDAFNPTVLSWNDNLIKAELSENTSSGSIIITTYEGLTSQAYSITLGQINPVIDRIVPNICDEGDLVAIVGTGFGDKQGRAQMVSEKLDFEVMAWSDKCVVISSGYGIPSCDISIITDSKLESAPKPIIINAVEQIPIPRIARISPAGGPPGSLVKIIGSNFGEYKSQLSYCLLGNTTLELSSGGWTDTEITARISVGAKTNYVRVLTNHGESNQAIFVVTDTVLPEDIVINPKPSDNIVAPFILDINPKYRANAGSTLLIRGKNFGRTAGKVHLNGVELEVVPGTWNQKALQVVLPSTPGSGNISITNTLGTSNKVSYVVLGKAPVIDSINPNPVILGQDIVITGSDFGNSGTVRTGVLASRCIAASNIIEWTDTRIRVKTSADMDLISRRIQVTAGSKYVSNWFEFEIATPSENNDAVPISAGDIRNEAGQFVAASSVNPVFANIPTNAPVVRNLNADKWQGKDWEDVEDLISSKVSGRSYQGDKLVSINNVRPDPEGNIKLCAAGGLEIVSNSIDHEVIVSANSDIATDDSGLVIQQSGVHDITGGEGIIVSRNGNQVVITLDYGLGLNQVSPGDHKHGSMTSTIVFE